MLNQDYSLLLAQADAIVSDETDYIANAANLSSLIYHNVENLNWVGFYFDKGSELVLGPFSGQLACTRIAIGKGVCGTAYAMQQTLLVDDVHQFDGHIACDSASESELVVPFESEGLSGVFDIDSPIKARFTQQEQSLFEQLIKRYIQSIKM